MKKNKSAWKPKVTENGNTSVQVPQNCIAQFLSKSMYPSLQAHTHIHKHTHAQNTTIHVIWSWWDEGGAQGSATPLILSFTLLPCSSLMLQQSPHCSHISLKSLT